MKTTIFIILTTVFSFTSIGQTLFPEKFEGCNTEHFALERDTTIAKIDKLKFLDLLKEQFGAEIMEQIKGSLQLQIIVYKDGIPCLISAENKTNVSTKELNLKLSVDNIVLWNKPYENIAAIFFINFESTAIHIARIGHDAKKGWHELKECGF